MSCRVGLCRVAGMSASDRLYIALDLPSAHAAEPVVKQLASEVGGFKVGAELFYSDGPAISDLIMGLGASLFLDLKLHDIPRTVEAGAKALAKQGAALITVHASGGVDVVRAAVAGASANSKTRVLAVTVLTSHNEDTLREIGVTRTMPAQVMALAELAVRAGAHGLVCSALEVAALRKQLGPDVTLLCPGIRPPGAAAGDQKRVATPAEALRAGADLLVVGRPIIEAADRRAAAVAIVTDMVRALG